MINKLIYDFYLQWTTDLKRKKEWKEDLESQKPRSQRGTK